MIKLKYLFFLALTFIVFENAQAQKMYIWCPNKLNPNPNTEQLKDIEINVLVKDSRLLTGKIKNKCTSEELTNSVFYLIKESYPNATVNQITIKKNKTTNCKILIEIRITAYYATFTSSMWYAQTDFSVSIIDYRKEISNEYLQDIHKEKKFFNLGGSATAKNNLNKSFIEANIELLDFLSDNLHE